MASLSDIENKINQLEAKRDELKAAAATQRQRDIADVVDEIRAKLTEYGISAKDLGLQGEGQPKAKGVRRTPSRSADTAGTVKHRGPQGQTWTSGTRGRRPSWLAEEIARSAGEMKE